MYMYTEKYIQGAVPPSQISYITTNCKILAWTKKKLFVDEVLTNYRMRGHVYTACIDYYVVDLSLPLPFRGSKLYVTGLPSFLMIKLRNSHYYVPD